MLRREKKLTACNSKPGWPGGKKGVSLNTEVTLAFEIK
jgi:hypothetical protein